MTLLVADIGIIIGCLFGGLALGIALGGVLIHYYLKKKNKKAKADAQSILQEANNRADALRKETESLYNAAEEEKRVKIEGAKQESLLIIKSAQAEADKMKAEGQSELANEKLRLHAKAEEEARALRKSLEDESQKLDAREDALDRRDEVLNSKESKLEADSEALKKAKDELSNNQALLEKEKKEVDELKQREVQELSRISSLSEEDAKREVMAKVREKSELEIAEYLKSQHDEAEDKAEQDSKNILCLAVERYAQDVAIERTTTTVSLPNDDMKGRIIGREGRNIKSLESLLGCDLLIDDTPGVITVSSFDPIRREIALETLNVLIKDGRIQPGRIEEVYAKIKNDIDSTIKKTGEDTCLSLGLMGISRQLYPYIGRLKYRTSFGQSVLEHSKQVASLCGMMAAELGLDETMAKRAGLLHDIGKSADFELEGSHVDIGVRLAKKFNEPDIVINAIASHHGDCEKKYLISDLVVAADTLSAARPGARRETLENYIRRVEDLEKICKSFDGVNNCYALQSGRDLRVMVVPEKVDDTHCVLLAQKIKDRIEDEMTYPGYIKVTVIRETRAIETAK